MNPRLLYHILNTILIAGGVGFILNVLHLVQFLEHLQVAHFFGLIGGAVLGKLIYGSVNKNVNDPMTANSLARKVFYLGMGLLATALIMRTYHMPYYKVLLYLDIVIQLAALGISYSVRIPAEMNEEILDA